MRADGPEVLKCVSMNRLDRRTTGGENGYSVDPWGYNTAISH